jgi:signal transduction histidine kinase
MLESLAHRAGMAIENARLYERAQQAATLEERQRLARELHDAVTQTLFAASLIGDALPNVWRVDINAAEQALTELRRLTWGALAEMRTLLLELRPAALANSSLTDLLRQLGDAVSGRSQVKVEFQSKGQRQLPVDVRVAFYRVAQEALNNILKHAAATRVTVSVRFMVHGVRLIVADNGRGFDISSVPQGRLGLGIMHERASAIGATLLVESRSGGGTRVQLVWRDASPRRKARRG